MQTGNRPRAGLLLSLAIFLFVSCEKQDYLTTPTPTITKTTDGLVPFPTKLTPWRTETNIPLPPFIKNWSGLFSAACFTIGGKGYVVGGGVKNIVGMQGISNQVWCFDTATRVWTQKANFPGFATTGAAAFVVNNLGYVCTGVGSDYTTPTSETWQYNPTTDTWIAKAPFAGGARSYAVGIGLNGKGYVGTGAPTSGGVDGGLNDWWQYDPSMDHWTKKTNAFSPQLARWGAVAFADQRGHKAYISTGMRYPMDLGLDDCWEYDGNADTWTAMPNLPMGVRARQYAVGVSIPQGGIVGTGYAGYNFNDFYEFDFTTKTWSTLPSMPGDRFLAEAFAVGNLICVGGGLYGLGSNDKTALDNFYSLYWQLPKK